MGKFKVPTLRNVDLRPSEDFVKAYGHNGYFKSLDDIVFFYHWRGMMDMRRLHGWRHGWWWHGRRYVRGHGNHVPGAGSGPEPRRRWACSRAPQVDNIVAFLKTLSDGYFTPLDKLLGRSPSPK